MGAPEGRIAGGTDEIMANIIAGRVLGMPQARVADKGSAVFRSASRQQLRLQWPTARLWAQKGALGPLFLSVVTPALRQIAATASPVLIRPGVVTLA